MAFAVGGPLPRERTENQCLSHLEAKTLIFLVRGSNACDMSLKRFLCFRRVFSQNQEGHFCELCLASDPLTLSLSRGGTLRPMPVIQQRLCLAICPSYTKTGSMGFRDKRGNDAEQGSPGRSIFTYQRAPPHARRRAPPFEAFLGLCATAIIRRKSRRSR